jgi:formylmethanofuran dehydrogenase subunit C
MQTENPGTASHGRWRVIANSCNSGACPTVYTDGGRVIVQGFATPAERVGIDVPEGEMLVEIPYDLLTEAFRNLS